LWSRNKSSKKLREKLTATQNWFVFLLFLLNFLLSLTNKTFACALFDISRLKGKTPSSPKSQQKQKVLFANLRNHIKKKL
jgi:hypothetical protein